MILLLSAAGVRGSFFKNNRTVRRVARCDVAMNMEKTMRIILRQLGVKPLLQVLQMRF